MASFFWSSLANGAVVSSFDPAVDVFRFNNAAISAADVLMDGSDVPAPHTTFTYGGKTVTVNMDPLAVTTANIKFADGSLLLLGNNSTDPAGDDGNNTLTGGAGDDQLIGLGGNDSLVGGGGNDVFTMYQAESGSLDVDTVVGGAGGADLIRFPDDTYGLYIGFNTAFDAVTGIQGSVFSNFDPTFGNSIALFGVERATGGPMNDAFYGSSLTHVNSLRTDVVQVFEGEGGGDQINGGTGNGRITIASYRDSPAGVTVNLGTGTATDGFGGPADTLTNIDGVFGSNFADRLTGGSAGAAINGGLFERFEGFSGNDTINGGSGSDRAEYTNSPGAVNVNLATGVGLDGWGRTDTLISIEQVRGSAFNDTITGGAGDESFIGDAGNDTIDGGAGSDQARYQTSTAAVTVDLGAGTASDGLGGTDTLIGIEGARGSDFADTLTGGAGGQILEGGAGNDVLDGGDIDLTSASRDVASYDRSPSGVIVNLGVAQVSGVDQNHANDGYGVNGNAAESDTLVNITGMVGSAFNDTLVGGNSGDLLDGRGGADSMSGGLGNDIYVRDVAGDVVTEAPGGGTDTVQSAVTYTLPANVEILTLTGTANINGTGSGGNNVLTGNGANNVLNGGAGTDTLKGMAGNDTMVWASTDSYDGGAGTDILKVLSGNLNLTTIANTKILNVETIDLTNGSNNVFTLNAADVLDISTTTNTLKVLGNVGDSVNIVPGFSDLGVVSGFHRYTFGGAVLLVDTDITNVA